MYEEFYGLSANPFRLTPDRKFWFGSEGHRKAMSYLKYGLYQGEGFIVVTGDVGTGKSTLVSQLFSELDGNDIVAAQIGTTQIDADDAIRLICNAFELDVDSRDKADLISAFEEFLIDQNQMGKRVLLVIDEAQNLPIRTLEELRMLSNFNVGGQPLFQSFLIGQPQFLQTVAHRDLTQLQQRIIASYKLESMSRQETEDYVEHRLSAVGWTGTPAFDAAAHDAIYAETKGVPRLINTLANRIMLFASLEESAEVTGEMVVTVIADLKKENATPAPVAGAAAASGVSVAAGGVAAMSGECAERVQRLERAVAALVKRIQAAEHKLGEHDEAIHEMIDLAMSAYSPDGEGAEEEVVQLHAS
jgi:putative secretion ATPase (PEP-CTERM system associated)